MKSFYISVSFKIPNPFFVIIFLSIFTVSCKPIEKQKLNSSNYSEVINNKFNGDLAFKTTAFIEKYWRVAGNTGFNNTIYRIENQLKNVGFIKEENASPTEALTYRIEKRPLKHPTWEPVNASVKIIGNNEFLLKYETNRNMIALNSFSTPKGGIDAEVIYISDLRNINKTDVKGKIVFAEFSPSELIHYGVFEGGAVGVLSYSNPNYVQPEKNTTSIQFRSIPFDEVKKPWAIAMSYASKEALKQNLSQGKATVHVDVETKIFPSEELTLIADIKGSKKPNERLVFSSHIQEPGANDNASGVGLALEMATLTAKLIKAKNLKLDRTLTFLWGDEIISTERYIKDDSIRAKGVKWGISLDMVGENTNKTGGTFLIEKMPDPSAIWTRGYDKHTEWGGSTLTLEQMMPHYLNDFLIEKFKTQSKLTNWVIETNPYEGGSDHAPFLEHNIPSVLFWHFTDQFYHTDNDRLDKVSKITLKNVGSAALVSAYTLLNSNEITAKDIIKTVELAAMNRLNEELIQSKKAIKNNADLQLQNEIIKAWEDWYIKALETTYDLVNNKDLIKKDIELSQNSIENKSNQVIEALSN